jgi:hypothetical protein
MNELTLDAALLQHRDITRRTGSVSNLQMQQLKMWPMVMCWADAAEAEVDTTAFSVVFDLSKLDLVGMQEYIETTAPDQTAVAHYRSRMNVLAEAVHRYFGPEYSVTVKVGGTVIGEYAPLQPSPTFNDWNKLAKTPKTEAEILEVLRKL